MSIAAGQATVFPHAREHHPVPEIHNLLHLDRVISPRAPPILEEPTDRIHPLEDAHPRVGEVPPPPEGSGKDGIGVVAVARLELPPRSEIRSGLADSSVIGRKYPAGAPAEHPPMALWRAPQGLPRTAPWGNWALSMATKKFCGCSLRRPRKIAGSRVQPVGVVPLAKWNPGALRGASGEAAVDARRRW